MGYYNAFEEIVMFQEQFMHFCQHVSLTLNMCLCYDLIHTLQNPFESAKYRLKYYLTFSFTAGVVYMYLIWGISGQHYPTIYF